MTFSRLIDKLLKQRRRFYLKREKQMSEKTKSEVKK